MMRISFRTKTILTVMPATLPISHARKPVCVSANPFHVETLQPPHVILQAKYAQRTGQGNRTDDMMTEIPQTQARVRRGKYPCARSSSSHVFPMVLSLAPTVDASPLRPLPLETCAPRRLSESSDDVVKMQARKQGHGSLPPLVLVQVHRGMKLQAQSAVFPVRNGKLGARRELLKIIMSY